MGYVKPSVFQGQYNLLCRTYETTLFPLLRQHGIAFMAYAPLAGGMLTGKVTLLSNPEALKGTRFEVSKDNLMGMAGRNWYDKPAFHDASKSPHPPRYASSEKIHNSNKQLLTSVV